MDPTRAALGSLKTSVGAVGNSTENSQDAALRQAAKDLEASFLAEMLKATGLGKTRESFGGGAGEDQFSSFLVRAQADEMVKAGGIGLAESLFEALKERSNGAL
ncbi:rod-binding protein [Aliiroseovarius crassostreae]|uniref:rod-binding protein n=1 Tax=Aliiroseovarius crassostreae TaxID=154981 RepID=UPI002200A057|nr:rod-binding protein [Aliiroseovarius crassostreae]UWQ01777.1 rod-binding protein [Aliiroseovarius crassostreae]